MDIPRGRDEYVQSEEKKKGTRTRALYRCETTKTWAKMTRRWEMRRLKREIGYVIYIAVLLRERRALESFYMHFLHVNTLAFDANCARERYL